MKEFPKMLYKNVEGKSPNHVVTNSKDEMDIAISKGFGEKLPFIHKGVVTHNVPSTVAIPMKDLVGKATNMEGVMLGAPGTVTTEAGSTPSQEGTESNDDGGQSSTEGSTAQW